MQKTYLFPARLSNQITKEYYFFLIAQINAGTCSKQVSKILKTNGPHHYYTYHLVSIM